ncbi:hypothetical protein [Halomicrococcus sp. SG-WS-1]|uniref:hypothetical protein n=1 Tax=Halomicrococcus sp. SG-WS-1 TaxID=3439057 RepID=UPI003F7944DF
MYSPLHLGFEHPNVTWIAVTAVVAFVAGLGVTAYETVATDGPTPPVESPEESK